MQCAVVVRLRAPSGRIARSHDLEGATSTAMLTTVTSRAHTCTM
jgi:hypothetical protein